MALKPTDYLNPHPARELDEDVDSKTVALIVAKLGGPPRASLTLEHSSHPDTGKLMIKFAGAFEKGNLKR